MFDARHSSKDIKILEPNGYIKEDTKEFFGELDKFIGVAKDEVSTFDGEESKTVAVMLMRSLIVKVIGEVTGKEYTFNGSGSIVEMDEQDVEIINKYNVSTISCCGSYSSPYFKFV